MKVSIGREGGVLGCRFDQAHYHEATKQCDFEAAYIMLI